MTENEIIGRLHKHCKTMTEAETFAIMDCLEELKAYKAIGTLNQCREAVERMKPKKPIEVENWGEYYKCPTCEKYAVDNMGNRYKYCPYCGTEFDWTN